MQGCVDGRKGMRASFDIVVRTVSAADAVAVCVLRKCPFWKGKSIAAQRYRCLHPSERLLACRPIEENLQANRCGTLRISG